MRNRLRGYKVPVTGESCRRALINQSSGVNRTLSKNSCVVMESVMFCYIFTFFFFSLLDKHHVNGNRMVEPFPEGTQMAIFGKASALELKLSDVLC